jgi:hypothetical protein
MKIGLNSATFWAYSSYLILSLGKAVCEFPGELANGHIEPTKFHYNIDETVTVICHRNYRLLGSSKLKCNSNGHWSSPKPHCRPFYL